MTNSIKWLTLPTLTTYLSTELNALADTARKIGAALDFNQETTCILELSIAEQASARSTGASVPIYLVKSADAGTIYEYGSDTLDPPHAALATIATFDAAVTARAWIATISIPADIHGKLLLKNNTGQPFAATGNTLKYALYHGEIE